MIGTFAEWQPRYAEQGISTFPVQDKKPAVRGYLKVGPDRSRELAQKFARHDAFGFALGRHSNIAVLDVDTSDERVLADALLRHGSTPIVVRSGSGNYKLGIGIAVNAAAFDLGRVTQSTFWAEAT